MGSFFVDDPVSEVFGCVWWCCRVYKVDNWLTSGCFGCPKEQ